MRQLANIGLLLVILGFLALPNLQAQEFSALKFKNLKQSRTYRTLMSRLATARTSVTFEEVELKKAVQQLFRHARVNLVFDRKISDRLEEPVSLTLKKISVRSILKFLANSYKIAFQFRDGIMVATTPEDALNQSMVLQIYSIRLISYSPPDFRPPVKLGINPGPPQVVEQDEDREREGGFDPDFIVDLIRQTTGDVWDADGASLSAHRGKLIVRHAPHIQRRVARLLNRLR